MLSTSLNSYGDMLMTTTGHHGADIASQRMDDLDKESLQFALTLPSDSTACDLGCGYGAHSLRLATVLTRVLMIDLMDRSKWVEDANTVLGGTHLFAIQKDATLLSQADLPPEIHLLYSQRFIHYLRYPEAKNLLKLFASRMTRGSMMFISASGMNSELGDGYAGNKSNLEQRFASLSPRMATKHQVEMPVCLYDEKDLERLGMESGFVPTSVLRSPFGNIKGCFRR